MAQTTFSGPILAGGIKNTTGTVVGTNVKNTGQVLMAQSFSLALIHSDSVRSVPKLHPLLQIGFPEEQ